MLRGRSLFSRRGSRGSSCSKESGPKTAPPPAKALGDALASGGGGRRRKRLGRSGRLAGRPPCTPAGFQLAMAALSSRSLAEVQRRVAEVHHRSNLQQLLRLYDGWAEDYDQDVAVLQYQAPSLAAAFLASVFQGPPENALVLDVACGTGLMAQELQAKGFYHVHGLDGSQGMLEHARQKGLYEDLKLCLLGQEALPAPEGHYDATVIVGALSEGQVPSGVIPQLLLVTKAALRGSVCEEIKTSRNETRLFLASIIKNTV